MTIIKVKSKSEARQQAIKDMAQEFGCSKDYIQRLVRL